MKTILSILISLIIISCNKISNKKVERDNEPDIYNLEETDKEINNAVLKAKQTFAEFENIFINDTKNENSYAIKQEYIIPSGGSEHIWIGQIQLTNNIYIGIINNEPFYTTEVKLGDKVTIKKNKISDWMVINQTNGKAKGGYTIRVLRDRMSDKEKQNFDANSGLVFE